MTIISTTMGKKSNRKNGLSLIVNKSPKCSTWVQSQKRQKDRTLKDELPRSLGAQYATGEKWKTPERMKRRSQSKNNAQLGM